MLAHSFDRFYVVTKYILPTLDHLKLSPIKYDKECNYLCDLDDQDNEQIKQNIKDLDDLIFSKTEYILCCKTNFCQVQTSLLLV